MSEPESAATEADLVFELIRERYGSRLTAEQLEDVRMSIAATIDEIRALRAVPLRNSDGPYLPLPPSS